MSIDLEALRMLGASTLAPDAAMTAAAERALFARPERRPSRRRTPVLAFALVVLGALFAVPAFGVQERLHDLFYGSPAPKNVEDFLGHTPGFTAIPAKGIVEVQSSKGLIKLYYADTADTGCVYEDVPYAPGATCGPIEGWSRLAVVGGPQIVTDGDGHSFTFAAGRFNPPAVGVRFVYADQVVPLQSYHGWFIAEPEPGHALIAFEAVDASGKVVNRQPLSDLTRDPYDPRTFMHAGAAHTLATFPFPGHGSAVISVGPTKAGTNGAWLTIDGLERSTPTSIGDDGESVIDVATRPGETYFDGFARPSATRAAIGFEDGSTDNVEIVEQHFFYGVAPEHSKPGHRPASFKILDANGRILDEVSRSTLRAALAPPIDAQQLTTGSPSPLAPGRVRSLR